MRVVTIPSDFVPDDTSLGVASALLHLVGERAKHLEQLALIEGEIARVRRVLAQIEDQPAPVTAPAPATPVTPARTPRPSPQKAPRRMRVVQDQAAGDRATPPEPESATSRSVRVDGQEFEVQSGRLEGLSRHMGASPLAGAGR